MSRPSFRSSSTLALIALAMLAATVGIAPTAHAAKPCIDRSGGVDIDGGGTDVVVGLPSYDVATDGGTVRDAGAIAVYSNVIVNGTLQKPQTTRLYTAAQFGLPVQSGAKFGAAVLAMSPNEPDFEGCGHLLVGAPGQNIDGVKGAGSVHLIDGWDDGLRLTWSKDQRDLPDEAGEPQDRAAFGSRLGAASIHRIAVGAPGRDVGDKSDAGAVATLGINDKEGYAYFTDWLGGRGAADRLGSGPLSFGEADYGRVILAAGVPEADVNGAGHAGAVAVTQWYDDRPRTTDWMTQDSPGAGDTAEAGDGYGSAVTIGGDQQKLTVAVGVPGEDVGTTPDAGMLSYVSIPTAGQNEPAAQEATLTQNSARVPGVVERNDRFGAALATGALQPSGGTRELAVGADGEAVGADTGAGAVTVNPVDPQLLPTAGGVGWDQDNDDIPGGVEPGDQFGSTITLNPVFDGADDPQDLTIVSSQREDVGAVTDAGRAAVGWFGSAGSKIDLAIPKPQSGGGSGMVVAEFPFRKIG